MSRSTQTVTASEAAVLADIHVRDVHRVFDEGLLPASLLADAPGRRVARAAIPLLAFYFGTADVLAAEGRRAVIEQVVGRGRASALRRAGALARHRAPIHLGEGVAVDLSSFVRRVEGRLGLVERARAAVETVPGMLGGMEPVLRGTRVPVRDVAAAVRRGTSTAAILRDHPGLSAEMVDLAAVYAELEPPRGRPHVRPTEDGGRVVRRGSVPRAAAARIAEMPAD